MSEARWHTRAVVAIVDFGSRFPLVVVALTMALVAGLGSYARGLEVNADLAELLPHDSPGFRAFSHQLGRAGGGSTLIVIASSPDRETNVRFIDALAERVLALAASRPEIAYVEAGTRDVRDFYERNKWLYADRAELERIDADLDHQIAIRSELVEDLFADEEPPRPASTPARAEDAPATPPKKEALGLHDALAKWDEHAAGRDSFPTGYFEARSGTLVGLRIAANTGLGGSAGDRLLADVQGAADHVRRGGAFGDVLVGYTGDIASAAGEKKALVSEAAYATGAAVAIVLLAIVLYFRSAWSLVVIALPVALGVAAAYAFARAAFGHVNAAGAFLGAIIVGNGINYPIVLLSRYDEFRRRGMAADLARRESVKNALRAELVGASVGAIAYGSLSLTSFRGFRQFGLIGFVGMLLVWASIIPLVPALLVVVDRVKARLPPWLRSRRPSSSPRSGTTATITSTVARVTTTRPWLFAGAALLLTIAASLPLPRWIVDPWEYDFGRLGSRSSDKTGAGEWSDKANEVFGGKMNIAGALMIADTPEQVPLLERQILDNDARDPNGEMIAEITTIDDALPGDRAEQLAKLEVLGRIRARLTPRVLADLDDRERETAARARPPETLRVLAPDDLPPLVRRRFTEKSGVVGTVFYVKPKNEIVFADAHNHLRLSRTTDNVRLPDGTVVMTASRSTIFAEMLSSLKHDGPLLSAVAFVAVTLVVAAFAKNLRVAAAVVVSLVFAVVWLLGWAAVTGARLNYVDFIALPITFAIGCEYPFNIADRARLLGGDVAEAVTRSSGAVLLCSFTTTVGYGSLLLSDFQALASFGALAVVGEIGCIFAAVFVLPSLLTIAARPFARVRSR